MRECPSRLVLLGHPVAHSLSPALQNAALRTAGIPLEYEVIDVDGEHLGPLLMSLKSQRAAGNVTVPHKETITRLCGECTPLVHRVGAANVFWVAGDGTLTCDNTDVAGFDHLVRAALAAIPTGERVVLLGAGGAASAALAAIEKWSEGDCEVALYNRHPARAERLAERFPVVKHVAETVTEALRRASIVVNATPVGLYSDEHPAPLDEIDPGATVVDLVYRPGQTAWVREALARGMRASDGLPMLLEQGALAFERWFGIPAPRDAMRLAVAAT
ncbi:MAG: shikimate dehydrogenase [Gemmatimonadaceae bacterium]